MTEEERPLRLDRSRDQVLAHAMDLVSSAWRSFDTARPEEPPLDDRVLALLEAGLPQEPAPVEAALDDAAAVLDESIAQARPRYFAFIGSSGLEIGSVADFLAHTYDVNLAVDARAATRVERQAIRWLAEFVGFPATDGTFTSGGTISNTSALAAARERALPGSRHAGLGGRPAAVYCSQEVHYSITRAVELLGIGSDHLRTIPIDGARRMDPAALAAAVDQDLDDGVVPIAVVATAGTTLTGAVDPLADIADVCAGRGVWLHVDGAYGLPAAATASRGDLFAGLARADSVSVDAHKWLYVPKACSAVLVRDPAALTEAFAHEQGYLPHQQHELHAVDITLEYSRPFRALKLWLAFRVHGAAQFQDAIERNIRHAELLDRLAREAADMRTLPEPPQLSIVPFRHAPEGVGDLNAHNASLAEAIQADGRVYLASALIDGEVWLRPCFVNFRTSEEDVRSILSVTRELGERLAGNEGSP